MRERNASMKLLWLTLILLFAFQPGGAAASPGDDAKAAIISLAHNAITAFSNGDAATARELVPATSIIDELPPFSWAGPGATDAWLAAVRRQGRRSHTTGVVTVLDAPTFIGIEGRAAYAVFPTRFSYRQAGVQVNRTGIWMFSARKTSRGWRIVAWAAGPR